MASIFCIGCTHVLKHVHTTSSRNVSLINSKNVMINNVVVFVVYDILKIVKHSSTNDGKTRTPSRKMRPQSCCRQHPQLLNSDLYGASCGHFTETIFDM